MALREEIRQEKTTTETLKTNTLVPSEAHQTFLATEPRPAVLDWAAITFSGGVILYWFGRAILRRFSKDGVELAKDRAEIELVKILQDDLVSLRRNIDDLHRRNDDLAKERNDAVSQLGRFVGEVEFYKVKIEELQISVNSMAAKIEEQNALLREVLIENASLRGQVRFLEESNTRLVTDVASLEKSITSRIGNGNG